MACTVPSATRGAELFFGVPGKVGRNTSDKFIQKGTGKHSLSLILQQPARNSIQIILRKLPKYPQNPK
jgi:hypothetical protein